MIHPCTLFELRMAPIPTPIPTMPIVATMRTKRRSIVERGPWRRRCAPAALDSEGVVVIPWLSPLGVGENPFSEPLESCRGPEGGERRALELSRRDRLEPRGVRDGELGRQRSLEAPLALQPRGDSL